MELYQQLEDIKVVGIQVNTFPLGIKEAFTSLMQIFGTSREYYGISWMRDADQVIYYAAVTQHMTDKEMEQFESLIIEKGNYDMETMYEWMSKTDCIKDVFHALMQDRKPLKSRPCIEWYVSDHEMRCMIRNS